MFCKTIKLSALNIAVSLSIKLKFEWIKKDTISAYNTLYHTLSSYVQTQVWNDW